MRPEPQGMPIPLASQQTGLSANTLRAYCRRGRVRAYRRGADEWRIHPEDVRALATIRYAGQPWRA